MFLFFSCKPTVLGKKHTRIVCQPARQAAETIIRSISCSLQLRLKSNERKKFGDKMLKWTFRYYNFFLKWAWFSFKKMQLSTKFWLIRIGTINSSTWWTLFYYLISKNLSYYLKLGEKVADFSEPSSRRFLSAVGAYWKHCNGNNDKNLNSPVGYSFCYMHLCITCMVCQSLSVLPRSQTTAFELWLVGGIFLVSRSCVRIKNL